MREVVAFHEAGHAVIARALWIHVNRVTIRPNEFSDGHVAHEASWPDRQYETAEDAEEREEGWRWRMEIAEDRAKLALAGPFAEWKFRQIVSREYFADFRDLFDVAEYLQIASGFDPLSEILVLGKRLRHARASRLWEQLQADTTELVELHWPSIERVAAALLIHKTLGPEQLDALIRSAGAMPFGRRI